MAVNMLPESSAAARGVKVPSASITPPAVSVIPAARACCFGGFNSSFSISSAVRSGPEPPNQPNSF
jgi:hypothetical protein